MRSSYFGSLFSSTKHLSPHNSNIVLYLLFRFFQDFALVYPVYMIYFEQQGLTYLQMSWLLAIWGVPVLLMELPSGVVADLWSRKWSLAVGMLLKAGGFCIWLLRPDFLGFALGFVLWGLQEGICTGVAEAMLYDSLRADGNEDRFVKVSGLGGLLGRGAIVISVLCGGLVFSVSPGVVMVASALSMLAGALCAALLHEPRPGELQSPGMNAADLPGSMPHQALAQHPTKKQTQPPTGELQNGITQIVESVRSALRVQALVPLVIFGALATVAYGVLDEYDFLMGREYGVPVALIGIWGGFRFLMEGVGALVAYKLETRLGLDRPPRLALWMGSAGLLLLPVVLTGSVYLLPLYFVFFFMMAVAELVFQGWVQHRVESAGRATVSSLVSLVYEAFGLALVLSAGPISAGFGLSGLFLAGGLMVSLASLLFGMSFFCVASRKN